MPVLLGLLFVGALGVLSGLLVAGALGPERGRMSRSPLGRAAARWLWVAGGATLGGLAVLGPTRNPVAAILGAALGAHGFDAVRNYRQSRRRRLIGAALPEFFLALRAAASSAGTVPALFAEAAEHTGPPLREEIRRILGRDAAFRAQAVATGLERLGRRSGQRLLVVLALAVTVAERDGLPLGPVLADLEAEARSLARERRNRVAEISHAASVFLFFLLLPPAEYLYLYWRSPEYLALLNGTAAGQWTVGLVAAVEGGAFWYLRRVSGLDDLR